jgi:glutamyl/glutaminyl-tRNA synthetase
MTTRFSPSLNGSLHLGHLWMAWLNHAWARQENGRFILRFDDLAPRYAGEDTSRQADFSTEGEELLRRVGILPDAVTYLSEQEQKDFPAHVGGQNYWFRAPSLEGWNNVGCSPTLVAARVASDIADGVTDVIRGEELTPELQLYEFINYQLGGTPRRLLYLPRLRVCVKGELTTISKTYGNLQLRDLFTQAEPSYWIDCVRKAGLHNINAPISLENLSHDPIVML